LFRWGKDVNDTGYKIFTLAYSKLLGFDCYLFYYPTGSYIPKHKDPKHNGAMYRFNIEIKSAKIGGQFICNNMIWSWKNRFFFFRADTSYHYVTKIESGSRIVLSFGKTIK
jgi:hypothetical protein